MTTVYVYPSLKLQQLYLQESLLSVFDVKEDDIPRLGQAIRLDGKAYKVDRVERAEERNSCSVFVHHL